MMLPEGALRFLLLFPKIIPEISTRHNHFGQLFGRFGKDLSTDHVKDPAGFATTRTRLGVDVSAGARKKRVENSKVLVFSLVRGEDKQSHENRKDEGEK